MNKILSLTILSLAFAWGFGADTDKVLPKAASDVVAELNASKTTATLKAIKKLQVVMGDLTRRGDLDGANATKAVMDGLQKGLDDAGKDANDNFIGSYHYVQSGGWSADIVIKEDGTNICEGKQGTWSMKGDKIRLIMYSGGFLDIQLPIKNGKLSVVSTTDGKTGVLTIQK